MIDLGLKVAVSKRLSKRLSKYNLQTLIKFISEFTVPSSFLGLLRFFFGFTMSKQSSGAAYHPPVARLLSAGEPQICSAESWPNYRQKYGLSESDIPELIRMMTDPEFWDSEEFAEGWSVVHAWRTLAQLKTLEAIAPLVKLWDLYEDDDWLNNEGAEVFHLIGPEALPALSTFLADVSLNTWARFGIADSIGKLGTSAPEHRNTCVAALKQQLEAYADNDPVLNGGLIAALLDLKAVETVALIEQAYVAKKVDDMVPGTWATVQIELGLKQESDFSPKELQPRFFRNMAAAKLIANPHYDPNDEDDSDFEDEDGDEQAPFSSRRPFWPRQPTGISDDFLGIPKQTVMPVQGFGTGGANSTKPKSKKKKKK